MDDTTIRMLVEVLEDALPIVEALVDIHEEVIVEGEDEIGRCLITRIRSAIQSAYAQ